MLNEILYEANISYLAKKFSMLDVLEDINSSDDIDDYPFSKTEHGNVDVNEIQVVVVGKPGYGKSTLLNKIIGENIFKTNSSCVKQMQSAIFSLPVGKNYYFSLYEFPGVGEDESADEKYISMFLKMITTSSVIVYLLKADQRDFSKDEKILKSLAEENLLKEKFIIGLNYVDKIEPISHRKPFKLSAEQKSNIDLKKKYISEECNISEEYIIALSASENFNLEKLIDKIGVSIIKSHWRLISKNLKKEAAEFKNETTRMFENLKSSKNEIHNLLNQF